MKHRILRINISLFVTLFGLIAGIDVQAYDRIELAGNVLAEDNHPQHHGLALSLTHKAESRIVQIRKRNFLSPHQ